jgi:hypothetical protein
MTSAIPSRGGVRGFERLRLMIAVVVLLSIGCATDKPASSPSLDELGSRITHFYEQPDPAWVGVMIRSSSELHISDDPNAISPTLGFIAAAAQRYPAHVKEWSSIIASLPARDQAVFWRALWLAGIPETREAVDDARRKGLLSPGETLEGTPPPLRLPKVETASDLDFLWGAFFASGDTAYIGRILSVLDWDLPKLQPEYQPVENALIYKLAVLAAAQWSLAANSRQHSLVLQFCRDELRTASEPRASRLREIIRRAEVKNP